MAQIRIHFMVPADKSPAPHMVSGEPTGALPLATVLQQSIGHQNQAFVCACNPNIRLSNLDRGTGEPYCVACEQCWATEVWKKADAETPHPSLAGKPQEPPRRGGCC